MKRLAAVIAATVLALTACTGGGDDKVEDRKAPSLPLPDKAPSARGPASGPALEPKVLLASSDALEEQAGSTDASLVQRRSGAFVSGRTVIGYSVDDISGYDLDSGKQIWRSTLDVGSGTVCFVSEPDRAVTTFTVAYGASGYCPDLATIRVSDGTVVKKSATLSEPTQFEGESAGGPVSQLFTIKGKDYLVDFRGVVWKMVKGEPQPMARLQDRAYFTLHPTPQGDALIGSRLSDKGRCRVDGYALPSFKHLWTQDTATLFPEVKEDCVIVAARGNSTLLAQQASETNTYFMVQVDPATGKVMGRAKAATDSGGKVPEGQFDLASASNQLDQAYGLPGGDTVFAQVRGLTRFSLTTGKVVWDLKLGQIQLDSEEKYPLTTVLPQGVTADGYLVATVSNNTGVEVVAIDVKTGKLRARWAVPKDYRNGFQVDPGMTLFDDGVVLTRNFEAWSQTFTDYGDLKEPRGDLFDIGVFTFPKPDNSASTAVPTSGPTDHDAKPIGGLTRPSGQGEMRGAGAITTGAAVIAYAGNIVTGHDPKTGKQTWTAKLDDDAGARVCVASAPDRKVKTFTVAVKGGAKDAKCTTLIRMNASDGSVIDRVEVPAATNGVSRIVVHQGVVFIVTGNQVVSRLVDGALAPQAKMAHPPYYLERTPEDPSLLVSTSRLKDGRDWAIDAYRLPSFAPVWSTTAGAVLDKVDPRQSVTAWRGNGLWVSTTTGDAADPEATVKDALAVLDPATGKVVARTGSIKRDYLADDLGVFTLVGAVTSAFDTVGFGNGDVVVPQRSGVMRYSLKENAVRWAVNTASIMDAMEVDGGPTSVTQHFDLIAGGKTVLVTMSNDVSVELMTLDAAKGTITGRWNIPKAFRNGVQASPDVTPFAGGVALSHNDYSSDYAFKQSGRAVPPEQPYDVGLFSLTKPKK